MYFFAQWAHKVSRLKAKPLTCAGQQPLQPLSGQVVTHLTLLPFSLRLRLIGTRFLELFVYFFRAVGTQGFKVENETAYMCRPATTCVQKQDIAFAFDRCTISLISATRVFDHSTTPHTRSSARGVISVRGVIRNALFTTTE